MISKKSARCSNFSLIELMMVMAIIAILTGLVVGVSSFASRRAAESKTISKLEQMQIALEMYCQDYGYFPQAPSSEIKISGGGIFAGFKAPTGRPYLEGFTGAEPYKDGWGHEFWYQCPGVRNPQMYDLWSKGAKPDDDTDDITNWKRN